MQEIQKQSLTIRVTTRRFEHFLTIAVLITHHKDYLKVVTVKERTSAKRSAHYEGECLPC